ncbi:1,2-dihydroxy-3-keto-5-methylthiopentene dioxygenase [Sorochytrium milnesiophthora]
MLAPRLLAIALAAIALFSLPPAAADTSCPSMLKNAIHDPLDNLANWVDDSDKGGSSHDYQIKDGVLEFNLNPTTLQRSKVRLHERINGTGRHQWRVWTPAFKRGDPSSIGSYLYHNDFHEVDFEIGFGAEAFRKNLSMDSPDHDNYLVARLSSQAVDGKSWKSHDSTQVGIQSNMWHQFTLDLNLADDGSQAYNMRWWIDGTLVKTSRQQWGPRDAGDGFWPTMSLENLPFMAEGYNTERADRTSNIARFDEYLYQSTADCPTNPPPPSVPSNPSPALIIFPGGTSSSSAGRKVQQDMVAVYYYDESPLDPREPHRLPDGTGDLFVSDLANYGVYYQHIDVATHQPAIQRLCAEKDYKNHDEIHIARDKLPDYESRIKQFFDEHLHEDEEVRYILDGSGYFDVRSAQDRWVRIHVFPGDLIVLPAGIYHRFTLDTNNYLRAMRIFKEEPKWTPYSRSVPDTEQLGSRSEYLQTLTKA